MREKMKPHQRKYFFFLKSEEINHLTKCKKKSVLEFWKRLFFILIFNYNYVIFL